MTQRYRSRIESLLALDDLVETVFESLEKTGQLEDTVVIYTSDNGFMAGEHRMGTGKIALYDESVRQPLVIRGPGLPRGSVGCRARGQHRPGAHDRGPGGSRAADHGRREVPGAVRRARTTSRSGARSCSRTARTRRVRTRRYTYIRGADGSVELYDNVEGSVRAGIARRRARARGDSRTGWPALLERLEGCEGDACRVPAGHLAKPVFSYYDPLDEHRDNRTPADRRSR